MPCVEPMPCPRDERLYEGIALPMRLLVWRLQRQGVRFVPQANGRVLIGPLNRIGAHDRRTLVAGLGEVLELLVEKPA